jgi:tRNA(adenine34) deaminase
MDGKRIIPSPPPGWGGWEEIMRLALAEAVRGAEAGEVPVGALVLEPGGRIVGRGFNRCISRRDPSAHAEILALREAGAALGNYRLNGAFLAVTLEPCQMCAGAIIQARLAGVAYGARDGKAGAVESRLDGLDQPFHNHHPWHCGGILEEECSTLLSAFFTRNRTAGTENSAPPVTKYGLDTP